MKKQSYFLFSIIFLLFYACNTIEKAEKKERKAVVIHTTTDASTLNPISARGELANILSMLLYQPLIAIDYKSNQTIPVLAKSLPSVTTNDSGEMIISYSIKKEAQFDNGRPIRAKDIAFSLKLNLCPFVNNGSGPSYYSMVKSISYSTDTASQLTLVFKNQAIANEFRSGDFYILPWETFDSSDVLAKFTINQLQEDDLEGNDELKQFAETFNTIASSQGIELVNGSGPYKVISWQAGERIILQKKGNWWGEDFKNRNTYFIANAHQLQYEIINDPITAIAALKAGKIELMKGVGTKDLVELGNHTSIETASALRFGYQYLGFNLKHSLLKEKQIRKVIELAFPREELINNIFKGEVLENKLPLPLQSKDLRNTNIKFPTKNIEKAKQLLTELGWVDNDQNGIVEKDGKELALTYIYNSGNEQRKTVGLVLQQELKKVGISLEVNSLEWKTFLKTLREGSHELFMSGTSASPLPPDFSSSFHSESANGGRNYANYENPKVDSLILAINAELDKNNRIALINEFQEIIADEIPYLFLFTKNENVAYSKQLKDVFIYSFRPHYWAPEIH